MVPGDTNLPRMYVTDTYLLRMDGTGTNLLRRTQNIHWSEHATVQKICGNLEPISMRLCQKRLQFARHYLSPTSGNRHITINNNNNNGNDNNNTLILHKSCNCSTTSECTTPMCHPQNRRKATNQTRLDT